MRTRVITALALILTVVPLALVGPATAAKAPAPQVSNTNCSRLYGYVGTPVKEAKGDMLYPIFITNISHSSCEIVGVPSATFTPTSAQPATRVYAKTRGGRFSVAANGGALYVDLTVLPTTNWSRAACAPVKSKTTRIVFGTHNAGVTVVSSFSLCSKRSSATITGAATLAVPIN